MVVYLICGKKGSGKDTTANIINKLTGIPTFSFAHNLKRMAEATLRLPTSAYFNEKNKELKLIHVLSNSMATDWTELTPREVLINLGTFLRDNYSKDIWVNWTINETIAKGIKSFTISDCRYINEIKRTREILCNPLYSPENQTKVITIRVERDSNLKSYASEIQDPSETQLDDYKFDYVVTNNSTLESLEEQVSKILEKEGK